MKAIMPLSFWSILVQLSDTHYHTDHYFFHSWYFSYVSQNTLTELENLLIKNIPLKEWVYYTYLSVPSETNHRLGTEQFLENSLENPS